MLKRFFSTFIAIFTFITVIATSVYADFSIDNWYVKSTDGDIYTSKFDDGEIDGKFWFDETNDGDAELDYYEDDSALTWEIFQTSTSSKIAKLFPAGYSVDADNNATGTSTTVENGAYVVISFDISRMDNASSSTELQIYPKLSASYNAFKLYWKGSALTLEEGNSSNGTYSKREIVNDLALSTETEAKWHHFDIVIGSDMESNIYVNGTLAAEKVIQTDKSMRGKALTWLEFYFAKGANKQLVSLKNMKVYTASKSGFASDFDALAQDSLTDIPANSEGQYILTDDLTLPFVGSNGSVITWSSSNEAIISSDGTIHRHSGYELSEPVTLTAKVVNGVTEGAKDFTFYVKRKDFPVTADMDGDYIVYDDFSNSNLGYKVSSNQNGSISDKAFVMKSVANKEGDTQFYFTNDKTYFNTGRYVVEYDFKWSGDGRLRWEIRSNVNSGYRHLRLQKDSGSFKIYNEQNNSSDLSAKQISDIDILSKDETHHFKYLIDASNNKYSLYVDGALLVKDAYRSVPASGGGYANGCGSLVKQTYTSGSMNLELDNLVVYKLADSATFARETSSKTISLNGNNVSKIEATGTYVAKLNITDFTTEYTDNNDFVVALYNKTTNELISVKILKSDVLKATLVSDGSAERYGLYAKTTVDVPSDYENYYIKLMHWNGSVPVSSSVTVD